MITACLRAFSWPTRINKLKTRFSFRRIKECRSAFDKSFISESGSTGQEARKRRQETHLSCMPPQPPPAKTDCVRSPLKSPKSKSKAQRRGKRERSNRFTRFSPAALQNCYRKRVTSILRVFARRNTKKR